jgi:O-succinylbenzoate synthase
MGLAWRRRTFRLTRPLQVAGRPLHAREVLELRLDGRSGEAAPLPGLHGERVDALPALLPGARSLLAAARGSYRQRLARLAAEPRWVSLPPSLRCGLEGALLVGPDDLERPAGELPDSAVLVDRAPDAALDDLAGARCVKVKVGRRDRAAECRLLARLQEVLPAGAELRLDANRAFDLESAVAFAAAVAPAPAFIEEPVRDPDDLPAFVARTGWSVALDETLHDHPPDALSDLPGVSAWVVKPALLGVHGTLALFERTPPGVVCVVSAAFEGPVGLDLLATLARAAPGRPAPGLGTRAWIGATDAATPWREVADA